MAMKVELLKTLGKAARTSDTHKSLAVMSLIYWRKRARRTDSILAEEIVKFAAARGSQVTDKDLVQQVQTCRKDLENAKKSFSQIEPQMK